MELIRKRLIVETRHFFNFKKSTKIRFPWYVGPFIIKNKFSLSMIKILLKDKGFLTKAAKYYEPQHIISIRRQVKKRNPFEHFEVAGLPEAVNWSYYPHET